MNLPVRIGVILCLSGGTRHSYRPYRDMILGVFRECLLALCVGAGCNICYKRFIFRT